MVFVIIWMLKIKHYFIMFLLRYQNLQMGKIKLEDAGSVPDVYAKNQKLIDQVKFLELEVDRYKKIAEYYNINNK